MQKKRIGVLWLGFLGMLLPLAAYSASPSPASEGQTLVIVLKNGKQQSFAMADVARIEFQGSGSTAATTSRGATSTPRTRTGVVEARPVLSSTRRTSMKL